MMDELSTLASGFEIDGGQLRFELFKWLENECKVLHTICDFQVDDLYLFTNRSSNISGLDEEESELERFFLFKIRHFLFKNILNFKNQNFLIIFCIFMKSF